MMRGRGHGLAQQAARRMAIQYSVPELSLKKGGKAMCESGFIAFVPVKQGATRKVASWS